jgi:hypothetical protein
MNDALWLSIARFSIAENTAGRTALTPGLVSCIGRGVNDAQPAHNTPPPLCYSSVWLSMNVLVLDPKTVCVEASEVYQADQPVAISVCVKA